MRVPPFNPPKPGDRVGEYRILEVLGEGGFGLVYKVQRAGLFFALKLLRARALEGWGQREINILRHLEHRNVVHFHAYDRWPVPVHGYLYFVMEFIEGRTLEDWALDENPSARQVAHVFLELLRALAQVHEQGVLHRDLKRDNILIRDSDARPILVDFGVGWLAGGPTVTRAPLPPGTSEYRAPEAIRFERTPAHEDARYRPNAGDDLWAMGVTLYWLLTDVLPFGTRHEGGLNDRILTLTPKAPHEVNPRVPEALSTLCLRMLEKERAERFAGGAGVCRALEAALDAAELDGRWDLPLMDPDAPDRAPTQQDPDRVPRDAEEREALQWNVARPRRGRKAAREPLPEAEARRTPGVDAPAPLQADEPPARVRGAEEPAPPRAALAAPGAWRRGLSRLLPTSVGVLPVRSVVAESVKPALRLAAVVLTGVALACAAAFAVRPPKVPVSPLAPVPPAMTAPGTVLPEGWLPECSPPRACPVSGLAVSPETAEASGGAAPLVSPSPALPTAMLPRQRVSRLTSQDKPVPAPVRGDGRCKKWLCVAASCGWVFVACPGAQVRQVRSTPGPEECPSGAVKTMKGELGLPLSYDLAVRILGAGGGDYVTVRGGAGAVEVRARYFELPEGTVLTGDFILGEKGLHGRFKQAQTPGGKTYPVCMRFTWNTVEIKANTGPDTAKVRSLAVVRPVSHFD